MSEINQNIEIVLGLSNRRSLIQELATWVMMEEPRNLIGCLATAGRWERQGEEVPLAEASLVDAEPADGRAENSDLSCQGDAAAVEDATQSRGEGEEATPLLLPTFLLPIFNQCLPLANLPGSQRSSKPGNAVLRDTEQSRRVGNGSDGKQGMTGSRSESQGVDERVLLNLQGTVNSYDT